MDTAPWDVEELHIETYKPSRGPWFGVSQSHAYGAGKGEGMSSDARLMLMAMGRADTFGHAEFGDGELCRLLGVKAPAVSKLIAKLKAAGLAADESNARCVWLTYEFRGGGHKPEDSRWGCNTHGRKGAASVHPVSVEVTSTPIGLELYQTIA